MALLCPMLAVIVVAKIGHITATVIPGNCSSLKVHGCGYKGLCQDSQCSCPSNYHLHKNGRDCANVKCKVNDCVECFTEEKCIRCVNFISQTSGECMEKCNGQAEISKEGDFQGNICTESGDKTDIVIAVVAGVASGLLLCVIVGLGVFFYMRKTRKKINLQDKNYKSGHMEMGKLKQIPMYDNRAFENDGQVGIRTGVIDPDVYLQQLEQLRPHTETLMTVLSQIRRKLRAMEQSDPRVPTYKGVIHQLCRVLVLLHKKDPTASIPSDALGLIEWAQQMLEDHREQQQQEQSISGGTVETPISKISYIDVDFENTNTHVYATPAGGLENAQLSNSADTSGYYSSVPVPVGMNNNAYATINRSPNNPSLYTGNKNNQKAGSVKKVNNSIKNQTKNPKSTGYFANGRYYDPSPQPEVYAPASSYSDRSAGPFSTFIGDLPRSLSTSEASNSGGENPYEEEEVDMFPFDPREATDPVEV